MEVINAEETLIHSSGQAGFAVLDAVQGVNRRRSGATAWICNAAMRQNSQMAAARGMDQRFLHHSVRKQKGVVLWITLMVMVVLLGATLLIARNTAIGLGIEGNLAFKKNATALGDLGTETALKWLNTQGATNRAKLFKKDNTNGYFATWDALVDDPLQLDWKHAKKVQDSGVSGYKVDYLIHRMCIVEGAPSAGMKYEWSPMEGVPKKALGAQECVYAANKEGSRTVGAVPLPPTVGNVFYRVTSRVKGPRNTVSYVQSMVY